MDHRELITEVRSRMGGAGDAAAERAIEATLRVVAARMNPADAAHVARNLPSPYDGLLTPQDQGEPPADLDAFYRRVSELEGAQLGHAVEHAQSVCAAIMTLLDEQSRTQFSTSLWPELTTGTLQDRAWRPPAPAGRSLATARPGSTHPVSEAHPHDRAWRRTLATGRPGSTHPLSEARPDEHVQSESVVQSNNPHGDRKLSSGVGR
jgi:uncharacterized protein (DUF2267 family)